MAFSTFPSPRKLALPALKYHFWSSQIGSVRYVQVTLEQHRFVLCVSTYTWVVYSTCTVYDLRLGARRCRGLTGCIDRHAVLYRGLEHAFWDSGICRGTKSPGTNPLHSRQIPRDNLFFGSQMLYAGFWLRRGLTPLTPALFNGEQHFLFSRSTHWVISAIHSFYCSAVFHWDYLSIFQMMDIWAVSSLGLYININIFLQGLLWTYFSKVNT